MICLVAISFYLDIDHSGIFNIWTPARFLHSARRYSIGRHRHGKISAKWTARLAVQHAPPRNAACFLSSHLQCDNLLLDLLALGDKSIYCRVGIGPRMINVRLLPFLDQLLDVASQPSIGRVLHCIYIA